MTNFEKVKEMMDVEDVKKYDATICHAVHRLRGKECYNNITCAECYEWLKQEYEEPKQPVLTDEEREYLLAVIKPFRDRIKYVMKEENSIEEWISITMEAWSKQGIEDYLTFPNFQAGTMYKGMDTVRFYTLEELDL